MIQTKSFVKLRIIIYLVFSCIEAFPQNVPDELINDFNRNPTSFEKIEASYEDRKILKANSPFQGMWWRQSGPFDISGRITDLEVDSKHDYIIYAATASGGVFRSVNNGISWESIFDSAPTLSIGDIAISARNKHIIYVGTGESNMSRSMINGAGIYKSLDGGSTWEYAGLGNSQHISRIVIDPHNENIVYAATLGMLFTRNPERGIYKTTDGGKTWNNILYINETTGAIDLVMNPKNPRELIAAFMEKERRPWHFVRSGKGSGIYKTSDGGVTWQRLLNGLPNNSHIGRIGLAISPVVPGIIYALIDNQEPKSTTDGALEQAMLLTSSKVKGAELYRSNDGGESWFKTHAGYLPEDIYYSFGYYFGQIRINPLDPDEVYILGVRLYKSSDGGKTVKRICNNNVHVDHHAMWVNPKNPQNLILGNDGGVYQSYDGGKHWRRSEPFPISQYYSIAHDFNEPYNIYGGFQDHGNYVFSSLDLINNYQPSRKLLFVGDGAVVAFDPVDHTTVYAGHDFGRLFRFDTNSLSRKFITPVAGKNEKPFRFFWISPLLISKHDSNTLYYGGNKVFKSTNRGDTWDIISPDLTTNPKLQGNYPYGTTTALTESPLKPGLLYAGTDDGLLWVTLNDGKNWNRIKTDLPENKLVSSLFSSAFSEGTVYVSFNGDKYNDFETHLFKSTDFGNSFQSLVNNLPKFEPVNVIKESPLDPNILFIGTNAGVYVSLNAGNHWFSLHANLPEAPVYDLVIHPIKGDLIIGTHGRSAFILEGGIYPGIFESPISVKLPQNNRIKTDLSSDERYMVEMPVVYIHAAENDCRAEIKLSNNQKKLVYSKNVVGLKGINKFILNMNEIDREDIKPGSFLISVSKNDSVYEKELILYED